MGLLQWSWVAWWIMEIRVGRSPLVIAVIVGSKLDEDRFHQPCADILTATRTADAHPSGGEVFPQCAGVPEVSVSRIV
jgi:hypothetical protein